MASPVQAVLIPVNPEAHGDKVEEIYHQLKEKGYRIEMDLRNEKLGYKIREAQTSKVPYQIIIGDKEIENNSVNVRAYGSNDSKSMSLADYMTILEKDLNAKSRTED